MSTVRHTLASIGTRWNILDHSGPSMSTMAQNSCRNHQKSSVQDAALPAFPKGTYGRLLRRKCADGVRPAERRCVTLRGCSAVGEGWFVVNLLSTVSQHAISDFNGAIHSCSRRWARFWYLQAPERRLCRPAVNSNDMSRHATYGCRKIRRRLTCLNKSQ